MFDYQAGEKYKITLIMVGLAGLMAGMFFTILLTPTPEPTRHKARPRWADDPDVTGRPRLPGANSLAQQAAQSGAAPGAAALSPANPVDQTTALNLVEGWLPLAWDMSSGSAKQSQEKAITYMTPECAIAYRQNVWTDEIAKQIEQSGLQSSFRPNFVKAEGLQPDGTMVIYVEGQQTLTVPGKGARVRAVKLEYLLKQTVDGIRIAGISESGSHS